MVCSSYVASAQAITNIDAPVISITLTKDASASTATVDKVRMAITFGTGAGTQSPCTVLVNGMAIGSIPRVPNSTDTSLQFSLTLSVSTSMTVCAT